MCGRADGRCREHPCVLSWLLCVDLLPWEAFITVPFLGRAGPHVPWLGSPGFGALGFALGRRDAWTGMFVVFSFHRVLFFAALYPCALRCVVAAKVWNGLWCADREFECDYGYMGGADDLCVPYLPMDDPAAAPSSGPCGGGGEPVCRGSALAGVVPLCLSSPSPLSFHCVLQWIAGSWTAASFVCHVHLYRLVVQHHSCEQEPSTAFWRWRPAAHILWYQHAVQALSSFNWQRQHQLQ